MRGCNVPGEKNCSLCCKLLAVNELGKPPDRWCSHICKTGCNIYHDRPQDCRDFACVWLRSQWEEGGSKPLPINVKPSVCGVVLSQTNDGKSVVCHVNEGADWREGAIGRLIWKISFKMRVIVCMGHKRILIWQNDILGEEFDDRAISYPQSKSA